MVRISYFLFLVWEVAVAQFLDSPCSEIDCNGHGTCLGLKSAPLCFCELGYLGLRCEIPPNSGLFGGLFNFFGPAPLGPPVDPLLPPPLNGPAGPYGGSLIPDPISGFSDWLMSLPTALFPWLQNTPTNEFLTPLQPFADTPELMEEPSFVASAKAPEITENVEGIAALDSIDSFEEPRLENMDESEPSKGNVGDEIARQLPDSLNIFPANNYSLPVTQGLNACTAADCNNNGVCVGTKTLPVCLCHLGYSGLKCEKNVFDTVTTDGSGSTIICSASDCNNNGICIGTKSSFTCACKLGYSGQRCETTPYPLCDVSDCNNNGLCIGTKQSFTCACHIGFSGERCENAQGTLCEISDCNTQGICLGTKEQFTCLCNLGYTGKRCETRVLDQVAPLAGGLFCELKDCSNNGLCIGTKLLPTCICNLGYWGLRCEIEPLCSSLLQCSGNGICLGTWKNSICSCNLGWSGPNCQYFGLLGK